MAASSTTLSRNPSFVPSLKRHSLSPLSFRTSLKLPTATATWSRKFLKTSNTKLHVSMYYTPNKPPEPLSKPGIFHGLCYVVGDNIDTDQIIPAEYCTLNPSIPDDHKKLGSYALTGLPSDYTTRFIEPGKTYCQYSIIIAGDNFGCGSSREHAPVALGAAGVKAVVAGSYARIFFRNSVATGEVYALESEERLIDEFMTGDVVTIRLEEKLMMNHSTATVYRLKPIGDAGPVIEAGGIFAYARETGMMPSSASS